MENSLTSVGARQVDSRLKKDFLIALGDKISQTDFLKWIMQTTVEHNKDMFEFLQSKKLKKEYVKQPIIIATSQITPTHEGIQPSDKGDAT